jgi:site-specific recombinase XerD
MTEFLEYQQSRNLSPYTLRNYRMTFASFRRFLAETEVPGRASAA